MTQSLGGRGGENISNKPITNVERTKMYCSHFYPQGIEHTHLSMSRSEKACMKGKFDEMVSNPSSLILPELSLEHCLWGQETSCEHNNNLQAHMLTHYYLRLQITHSTHIHHSCYIFLYGDGINLRVPFGKLSKLGNQHV